MARLLLALSIFMVGASADPQCFGYLPNSLDILSGPSANFLDAGDVAEWTKHLFDLATLTRTTLLEMGDIAYNDNAELGVIIKTKLNAEIVRANKIYTDFKEKYAAKSTRRKRDINDDGKAAANGIGTVLTGSIAKTQPELGKLSPQGRGGVVDAHIKGVKMCGAEVCQSYSALAGRIAASGKV